MNRTETNSPANVRPVNNLTQAVGGGEPSVMSPILVDSERVSRAISRRPIPPLNLDKSNAEDPDNEDLILRSRYHSAEQISALSIERSQQEQQGPLDDTVTIIHRNHTENLERNPMDAIGGLSVRRGQVVPAPIPQIVQVRVDPASLNLVQTGDGDDIDIEHLISTKHLQRSMIYDMFVTSLSLFLGYMILELKLDLVYLALLFPLSEGKAIVEGLKFVFRNICKKKKKNNQSQEPSNDDHNYMCILSRILIKFAVAVYLVICVNVGYKKALWPGFVPLNIFYLLSLIYQNVVIDLKYGYDLYLKIYKVIRFVISVQITVMLRVRNFSSENTGSFLWPIYILLLLAIPGSIILGLYSICFRINQCFAKDSRSEAKKAILGNLFLIGQAIVLNTLIIVAISFFYQNFDYFENRNLHLCVLVSGITFLVLPIIALIIRKSLRAQFLEVVDVEEFSSNSNTRNNNRNQPTNPANSPNNEISAEEFVQGLRSALNDAEGRPNSQQQEKNGTEINDDKRSEYSFNYVAKKGSIMFINLKGEDLKAYSELDKSIAPSHLPMMVNPKLKIKNRFEDDRTYRDSFLDRLENLSNFSKMDKTPQQSKFKFRNSTNQQGLPQLRASQNIRAHRSGSIFAPRISSNLRNLGQGQGRGSSGNPSQFFTPQIFNRSSMNQIGGGHRRQPNQRMSRFSKLNQSDDIADDINLNNTPLSRPERQRFPSLNNDRFQMLENELDESVVQNRALRPKTEMIMELEDENMPQSADRRELNKQPAEEVQEDAGDERLPVTRQNKKVNSNLFSFKDGDDEQEDNKPEEKEDGNEEEKMSKNSSHPKEENKDNSEPEPSMISKKAQKSQPDNQGKEESKKDASHKESKKAKSEKPEELLDNTKQKRQKRLDILIEKNKPLKDSERDICHICMDATPDSIFHPCGHGGLCFECAKTIIETNATCHYCRISVQKVLRIDTHKKYKDIYRVKEVFKVATIESEDEEINQEQEHPQEPVQLADSDVSDIEL